MPILNSLSDAHTRLENFTPRDIKDLIQFQGKAREGNIEFVLKDPSPTSPHLQTIINDPELQIKSIRNESRNGEMYFDLKTDTKLLRIKIISHKVKEEKKR